MMKKTLATLLALTTILTVSLTACNNNTTHGNDGTDTDTDDLIVPPVSDTKDTEDNNKTTESDPPKSDWETISYSVYAMAKINLRSEDSQKSEKVATVDMGTTLSAVARNDKWYKLSYNGGTAYVNREHVTTSKDECTFEACESTVLKIKDNGDAENPYTVNLRILPIIVEDTLTEHSINHTHTANGELIKVAENKAGNWYKVKYTVNGETGDYYIKMTSAIKGYFGLTSGGDPAIG